MMRGPTTQLRGNTDMEPLGTVLQLHVRDTMARCSVSVVQANAGIGLADDRHASQRSPRQVLLTSMSAYVDLDLPAGALGENVLLDFDSRVLRSGDVLAIGEAALLWVTFRCEPCAKLEQMHRGVSKAVGARRGMLARVLQSGAIREGDTIGRTALALPAIDDDWRKRVVAVASAVPDGCTLEFGVLAELAGVSRTYCRAFPRVLAALQPSMRERIHAKSAQRSAMLGRWRGEGYFDGLVFREPAQTA